MDEINAVGIMCSVCKRIMGKDDILFQDEGIVICNVCVIGLFQQFQITQRQHMVGMIDYKDLPYPKQIKNDLDDYVIGQDEAKKILSVAVRNHYKRIFYLQKEEERVEIDKTNILLMGPTGVGKTLLAKTLARILAVPFVVADATSLTQAGYVGDDVENILSRLLAQSGWNLGLAEIGIIYLDEIDKIGRRSENPSITRDVSGEGVQQSLLKIIEGNIVGVHPQGGRKHPEQDLVMMDTSNILFICGGMFEGLDEIVSHRLGKNVIGFGTELFLEEKNQDILPEDLISFGLIPELVGRIPVVSKLNALTIEDLMCILTDPKNALLKQYESLAKMDGLNLVFSKKTVEIIAEEAEKRNIGARGLRTIVDKLMRDIFFDAPYEKGELIITPELLMEKLNKAA